MKNYYVILEISQAATLDEIRKSFHRLAHKHHPDKGGDVEKMKELTEAWSWMQLNHRPGNESLITVEYTTPFYGMSNEEFNKKYQEMWQRMYGNYSARDIFQ